MNFLIEDLDSWNEELRDGAALEYLVERLGQTEISCLMSTEKLAVGKSDKQEIKWLD